MRFLRNLPFYRRLFNFRSWIQVRHNGRTLWLRSWELKDYPGHDLTGKVERGWGRKPRSTDTACTQDA